MAIPFVQPPRGRSLAGRAAAVLTAALLTVAPCAADQSDVYARMQRINPALHSYEASVRVEVVTHSFPFLSPTLDGTVYFRSPDQNAVEFKTVPVIANQLKKVVVQLEPASEWPRIYTVTPAGDDGTTSTFRLVRKKHGRIDHVDVSVDDKTATVSAMTYVYNDNGGSISFNQTWVDIDGNYVLKSQTGKVDIPHYSADVTSTFSDYKLNVEVPDTVFAS
jgi:outer membrane lipoprotein-sorting protein